MTRAASKGGYEVPKVPKPKSTQAKRAAKVNARIRSGDVCGAKKRHGGRCNMPKGWGTNHPGIGACKMHGGSVPNHIKAAAKDEYRILLGKPVEVSPEQAIINCIQIRQGEVEWLSIKMAELDAKEWVEDTMLGKQFHLYARERQAALRDVARFSQLALSMNIEERRVRIAETFGETIANLLRAVLDQMMPHLTPEGRALAPKVVRTQLLALSAAPQDEAKAA